MSIRFWKRWLRNKEGATAVEYAVLLALIVVVCVVAVDYVGDDTRATFQYMMFRMNHPDSRPNVNIHSFMHH